ncbi:MarC family protein [Ruegeria sp. HKCCSP335]|uniref:MarC family protein n=1 Tax=Ruegeria sp. HKCCSP335 TaxID=2794833 RepID=UPI001AE2EBFE|nr:MarC family protein [Ruegeria sp. HKCCSP335]
MSWTEILVLLFVTIGPIRAALIYLGLTKSADAQLKRSIAIRTVMISTVICVMFAIVGAVILSGLKVSVEALLIAGGAILFVFALQLVIGEEKQQPEGEEPPAPSIEIATFPLAVPLMASPHGLVAIVAIEATLQGVTEGLIFVGCILAIMAFNLFFLLAADKIFAKIPPAILKIFLRVVGLLLCALAVQLIIFGFDGLGLIPNPEIET